MKKYLIWDDHSCLPLTPGRDLGEHLRRVKNSGVHYVSVNIGMDFNSYPEICVTLNHFRSWIANHIEDYILVKTIADVDEAFQNNKLAISFDLEGTDMLQGRIEEIERFHSLGVRQMLMAYNRNNAAGAGCQGEDVGLSNYGRRIVREMNRVGMLVDASHAGVRTTFDLMESSATPVIFSHSNVKAICDHPRNITDEQIKVCAQQSGVIGINGIGIFLRGNQATIEAMVEQIDYVTEKVGWQYVGVGLDYVFDENEIYDFVRRFPHIFPPDKNYDAVKFVPPEELVRLPALLEQRGYTSEMIVGILGNNFYRVAAKVW